MLDRVRADGEAAALRISPFVGQMADKVYRPKGEPRVLRVNILWRGGVAAPCGRELTLDRIAPGRLAAEQSTALRIIAWLGPVAPVDLISTQTAAAPGRSCSRSAREPY